MRERARRCRSELKAEPGAGTGNPRVTGRQICIRDMVEKSRHIDRRGNRVTEFGTLPKQNSRTEQLSARRRDRTGQWRAVMNRAAKAAVDEDAVAWVEEVLDQHDPPGKPEIAVAGISTGIDVRADMRPRRADDIEDRRWGEQHLNVDVAAGFPVLAKKGDVMGETAD